MIITEKKPFGMIKEKLDEMNPKKIAVISCNACARICGVGGSKGLKELENELSRCGYEIFYSKIIPMMCNYCIEKRLIDFEKIKSSDIIISLGCKAGTFILKKMFPNKIIIEALDTKGLGAIGKNNELFLVREF